MRPNQNKKTFEIEQFNTSILLNLASFSVFSFNKVMAYFSDLWRVKPHLDEPLYQLNFRGIGTLCTVFRPGVDFTCFL